MGCTPTWVNSFATPKRMLTTSINANRFNLAGMKKISIPLLISLAAVSCSENLQEPMDDDEHSAAPENNTVPSTWIAYNLSHQLVLRMADEHGQELQVRGSEEDPFVESRGEHWETNTDLLVDAGVLRESEEGYVSIPETTVEEAVDQTSADFSLLGDAMSELLLDNDADWCGTSVSGGELKEKYLDTFTRNEDPAFDTKAEYLESIEDYVDCGDGYT